MRRSYWYTAAAVATAATAAVAVKPLLLRAEPPRPTEATPARRPAAPPRRPSAALPPPQLLVSDAGSAPRPLPLVNADIRVTFAGALARTTMTLTFQNDTDRTLTGEMVFPLPEGAALSGYGIDVNGEVVDAVPVEKQEARVIFEKEVRKGVDPGLVEQTVGNNFRTRVYPILARGTRTLKIEYVGDADEASYTVPLRWGQTLPAGSLSIDAVQPPGDPRAELAANRPIAVESKGDGRFAAKLSLANAPLNEDLVIHFENPKASSVAVERFTRASAAAPEYFFTVRDTQQAQASASGPVADFSNRRIGIVWDASGSRRKADIAREIGLLGKLLQAANAPEVDLIVVRNDTEAPQTFSRDQTGTLLSYLRELTYDGGTNLGGLRLARTKADASVASEYGCWLLFTDGIGNLGTEIPAGAVDGRVPVFAASADLQANHTLLKHLCEKSGGSYLNLLRLTDEEAQASFLGRPYSLMAVTVEPSGAVADITPSGRVPVAGHVTVAGRLVAEEAQITLHYGRGPEAVEERKTFTLRRADAADTSGLVARHWAKQRADTLSLFADRNREALRILGRQYNIVTANTSLLVLETLEQHLEYGITPARSRAAMYDAYLGRMTERTKLAKQEEQSKLNHLLALWNERTQWWGQERNHRPLIAGSIGGFKGEIGGVGVGGRFSTRDSRGTVGALAMSNERELFTNAGVAGAAGPRQTGVAGRDAARVANSPARPVPTPVAPGSLMAKSASVRSEAVAMRGDGAMAGAAGGSGAVAAGRATAAPEQRAVPASEAPAPDRFRQVQQVERQVRAAAVPTREQPMERAKEAKKDANEADAYDASTTATAVSIKAWSPDTPYLKALKAAPAEKAYTTYLAQRDTYGGSPAFYLDCAEHLMRLKQPGLALRVLTNLAELNLEEPQLLRILAHRMAQLGERDLAIGLFEKVAKLRPEEPQSFRDLALVLSDRGDARTAAGSKAEGLADYNRAIALLHKVAVNRWDRFDQIEVLALTEANRVIARARPLAPQYGKLVVPFTGRLVRNLPCDVRILMTWDTDQTDMDLHVIEPSGEDCYYGNNHTASGGHLSRDFTEGYGPEEYCVRRAPKGAYKIQTNYFGTRQQQLTGGTTVQATVITNWGRPTEKKQYLTLRLTSQKETITIGTVKR